MGGVPREDCHGAASSRDLSLDLWQTLNEDRGDFIETGYFLGMSQAEPVWDHTFLIHPIGPTRDITNHSHSQMLTLSSFFFSPLAFF